MIERVANGLNRAFLVIAAVFMVLMMLQITLDVVMRAMWNTTLVGTLEFVSYYDMVGLVFLSLGYVELRHENIRVDLFAQMMPQPVQLALYLLSCILGIVFFGMLGWQTLEDAISAAARRETAMANFVFHIWPARWALPLGFLGLLVALLCNFTRAIAARRAF